MIYLRLIFSAILAIGAVLGSIFAIKEAYKYIKKLFKKEPYQKNEYDKDEFI